MEKNKYHLIGIGGIGMSALAEWLLQEGYEVSGSDLCLSPLTKRLQSLGAKVTQGHFSTTISNELSVVFSSDIPETNSELSEARRLGCETLHRSDLARRLIGEIPLFAITGSHGKTTTTALLTEVFEEGGLSPSFLLGGISLRFGVNGRRAQGNVAVLEADESDGSFLNCSPLGAIITNFDREHLRYWKTEEALSGGFLKFRQQVKEPNLLFYCGDDPVLANQARTGVSYGFEASNDLIISNVTQTGWQLSFDITFEGKNYQQVILHHIGRHQALNAGAVFGLALRYGVAEEKIRQAFLYFKRVKRRLEIKGEKDGILFLDDYGHHPTEIAATLKGLRQAFPTKRIVVVFQPHRYSRTEDCLSLFGKAFNDADLLFMTEIYSAGEPQKEGISSLLLQKEIQKLRAIPIILHARDGMGVRLKKDLKSGDLCVSFGAGDITHLYSELA
jgi:UDP-N-acetylmuramate--alanine ligase